MEISISHFSEIVVNTTLYDHKFSYFIYQGFTHSNFFQFQKSHKYFFIVQLLLLQSKFILQVSIHVILLLSTILFFHTFHCILIFEIGNLYISLYIIFSGSIFSSINNSVFLSSFVLILDSSEYFCFFSTIFSSNSLLF
ncbi:hypothetical protein HOG21_03740 [bacterium]|nr:hypothetical protein [bacterium]